MKETNGAKIDWTPHYTCIGEFVVEFEQLVDRIRFTCSCILQTAGLKKFSLGKIIFGQKYFTADPLIHILESLSYEMLKGTRENDQLLKDLSKFKKAFTPLIAFRNDLLHGTHLIGPTYVYLGQEVSPDQLVIKKNSPNKEGDRLKYVTRVIKDVEKETEKVRKLNKDYWEVQNKLFIACDIHFEKLEERK